MAIGGVLPYRQPDMQGFQLLAGVLKDRQRQQQQEDFYKRMQALESDYSKKAEDYDTDIFKVESEMSNVEAGASEDPVAAAERMKALSGQRQNLLQQKQARARRGGAFEYSMKARALMNKYGSEIDKYDPFTSRGLTFEQRKDLKRTGRRPDLFYNAKKDKYIRGVWNFNNLPAEERKDYRRVGSDVETTLEKHLDRRIKDAEMTGDVETAQEAREKRKEISQTPEEYKRTRQIEQRENQLKEEKRLKVWGKFNALLKAEKANKLSSKELDKRLNEMAPELESLYGAKIEPGGIFSDPKIVDSNGNEIEKADELRYKPGVNLYTPERPRAKTSSNPGKDLHKGEVVTPEVVARYKEWAKEKAPGDKKAQKRWFNWRLKNEGWVRK